LVDCFHNLAFCPGQAVSSPHGLEVGGNPMAHHGSVTCWLDGVQAGDAVAAQRLWEGYFHRLVGLARLRLQGMARGAADEEDVALSAFDSFCRGAEQGRFPRLDDRDDLWQVLVLITARKAADLIRAERAQKRGGGRFSQEPAHGGPAALSAVVGAEPTPSFAAQMAEELRRRLDRLGDDELRAVALWKMEGHTNAEIAAKLGRSLATVERKLKLIRRAWQQDSPDG
jgi:DNA-directed RNA polymerase specialized sigma24 family protein